MRAANRLCALAAAAATGAGALGAAAAMAESRPARDPAVAVAEQFADAEAAGSNAALILFILRYPDEPQAATARAALAARRSPDPRPDPGPDGAMIAAFDAARLSGDPAALKAFAAAYPNTPLAAEALRPDWAQ